MADVVGYGQTTPEKPTTYGNLTSNTLLANSGVFPIDLDVLEDATETANLQADLWDIAGRRIERRIQFEATNWLYGLCSFRPPARRPGGCADQIPTTPARIRSRHHGQATTDQGDPYSSDKPYRRPVAFARPTS